MTNFLYVYTKKTDPRFDEFTYGEANKGDRRADMLRNELHKGDYIFFHHNLRINAYFVVDYLLDGNEARQRKDLRGTYQNEHLHNQQQYEDIIVFGDKDKSRKLDAGLPLTRDLIQMLSIPIRDSSPIGSALRNVKGKNCKLSAAQVRILLEEIARIE